MSALRSRTAVVAAAAIFGLTYGLSAPLIALELSRRGLGETWIGVNAAMYALGVLVNAALLPYFSARWNARRIFLGALLAVALVMLAFPWAPLLGLWLWFPLRFLMGMASESVFVMSEAWVNQLSSEQARARSIAIYTASVSLGFALGPLILNAFGSQGAIPFLIGSVLALVAFAIILMPGVEAPRFERAESSGLLRVFHLAPVALAATALNSSLETSGLTFLPLYAMRLGWSEGASTALISTLMFGAIVLQLPIGWLGDRFDRRKLVLLFAVLSAVGALLWPFAIANAWVAYPLVFVWGGVFVGIYTLMITIVGSRFSGGPLLTVYAAMSVAWGLGALGGPPTAGLAMEATKHGLPWFAAAACAVFAIYAWRKSEVK